MPHEPGNFELSDNHFGFKKSIALPPTYNGRPLGGKCEQAHVHIGFGPDQDMQLKRQSALKAGFDISNMQFS
jgi:hypothetical protein